MSGDPQDFPLKTLTLVQLKLPHSQQFFLPAKNLVTPDLHPWLRSNPSKKQQSTLEPRNMTVSGLLGCLAACKDFQWSARNEGTIFSNVNDMFQNRFMCNLFWFP